jgi:hypothetical protein
VASDDVGARKKFVRVCYVALQAATEPQTPQQAVITAMSTHHNNNNEGDGSAGLIEFNTRLLEQAQALAAAHASPGRPLYAGLVGSHLRHVIEHYEALLLPTESGSVDYDARPRDAALEACPNVARSRLQALQHVLTATPVARFAAPLHVKGQGGMEGECRFRVTSSLGRELAFVASHTIHHFALLATHFQQQGIPTPEEFGKAPATRAHERSSRKLACA